MDHSRAELVLHPVRLQIIHALAGGHELTPHELRARLPAVPHATLYRHVNALTEGGILRIVRESPVRGAVERVYALAQPGIVLSPEDLAGATPEEHLAYFAAFLGTLLADFERHVRGPHPDFSRTGVAYRQSLLHLTDEEYLDLARGLTEQLERARANRPAPGRRLRRLSMVVIPEAEPRGEVEGRVEPAEED
jgi:DNA-binding transcriptional ArsR family regulator